jgi:hypothetical protein
MNTMLTCRQPFSDKEILNLHAEIKAMQVRWGLSYKDAAHRLHMMEVQKLLAETKAHSALTETLDRIDGIVHNDMFLAITEIDKKVVDPK